MFLNYQTLLELLVLAGIVILLIHVYKTDIFLKECCKMLCAPRKTTSYWSYYNTTNDIIFDKKKEAKEVLSNLRCVLNDYGEVSVADLYDLCSIKINKYKFHSIGWKDLKKCEIVKQNKKWTINFPEPITLYKNYKN